MTEPMTPPECDLRGLPFMPLDVVRLGDSDLFALSTGDEFKAAVALWCKSWLQVPAASLPNDDRILAHLSGTGSRWPKVRAMALRGWVECSDGRLYHPVVAEKARHAWKQREQQRARANRRWGNDGGNATPGAPAMPEDDPPQSHGDAAACPAAMQGRGRVKGERDTSLRSVSPARVPRADRSHFEDFWAAYPRKVGKLAAERAFKVALAKGATVTDLAAGLNRQVWPSDPRFVPHPATWLNQGRWNDDPAAAAPAAAPDQRAGKLDWLWHEMREQRDEFPDFASGPGSLLQ